MTNYRLILSSFSIAICALVLGCKNSSDLILEATPSSQNINLKRAEIAIPVDSLGLSVYGTDPTIYKAGNDFLLYAYNTPQHSIDVYNLTQKTFKSRIKLHREGPNQVNKVYNSYVLNPDSIYIMGKGKLYLLNQLGEVTTSYNTIFESSENTEGGYFHSPNEANFIIEHGGAAMLGFFIHYNTIGTERTEESLSNPILGRLNLKDEDLSFYPLTYSQFIQQNQGDFSELKPNFTFTANQLIYNWPIESNIYTFEYKSGKKKILGAKSDFSANAALTITGNSKYDYRNEGTWFNSIKPYPGTKFYYRTHWSSQPRTTPNGDKTDASTKPGYIMLLSENFEVIEEIELDSDCFLEGSFATNDGIFFWAKDGMNENEMRFCVYSVNQ
ncbi:DUF4221 family protein [Roseivirga pacifica]|uniref:DUF4221 family protein n=1 Tax=Roseivirga pacifica TaxID=1267423 RepID=UPI003BAC1E85